jgi:hypothetical protein
MSGQKVVSSPYIDAYRRRRPMTSGSQYNNTPQQPVVLLGPQTISDGLTEEREG